MGQYYSSQEPNAADAHDFHPKPEASSTSVSEVSALSLPAIEPVEAAPTPKATPKPPSAKKAAPTPSKAASPVKASATPVKTSNTPKSATPKQSEQKSPRTPKSSSPAAAQVDASDQNELRVEVPSDLSQCKLVELRELAAENSLKTTGSKYELIGRLLGLFPSTKLTEESLNAFKLLDLKSMAKGVDLPQVGSKAQIVSSLLAHARNPSAVNGSPRVAGTARASAKTPQPPKRKRAASIDKAPQTERKTKRARSGSNTKLE